MLGKKKQQAPGSHTRTITDSQTTVYDFQRRHRYESYRPATYTLYGKLEEAEMLPRLDEHLNRLFSNDGIDSGNPDVLQGMILALVSEGVIDLRRQKIRHKDMIRRLLGSREADKKDYQRILEQMTKELENLEKEYKMYCDLEQANANAGGGNH